MLVLLHAISIDGCGCFDLIVNSNEYLQSQAIMWFYLSLCFVGHPVA